MPKAKSILRHARIPDGVGAFVAGGISEVAGRGLDRGALALAGALLAIVTLGGGCLTIAVGKAAQGRL